VSVHFVTARPGGGKSYYALKLIVQELVMGSRVVVTNLPLRFPDLNEWLQRNYPSASINLHERIVMMEDSQVPQFFRIRPGWRVNYRPDDKREPLTFEPENGALLLDAVAQKEWEIKRELRRSQAMEKCRTRRIRLGKFRRALEAIEIEPEELHTEAHPQTKGIFYVLDEVHLFFNARLWGLTGFEVTCYLSQHRKLGDDVIAISQHVDKVDKQFRMDAQDSTVLRNLGKETYGAFRLPGNRVLAQVYLDVVRSAHSKPSRTFTFAIDVAPGGLAHCYDTARGVGVVGQLADQNERREGWHWGWAVAALLVVVLGVLLAPWLMVKGSKKALAHAGNVADKTFSRPASPPPASGNAPLFTPQFGSPASVPPAELTQKPPAPVPQKRVTGFFAATQRVLFNDGSASRAVAVFPDKVLTEEGLFLWESIPVEPPVSSTFPAFTQNVAAPLPSLASAPRRRLVRVHGSDGSITEHLQER
jgi:hypothetical protein